MADAQPVPHDIRAEYLRRRKEHGWINLAMLAILIALIAAGQLDLKPPFGVIVVTMLIALLIGCFVVVFRNWRCPACNRFLGAQSTAFGASKKLRNCPKCGVELVSPN